MSYTCGICGKSTSCGCGGWKCKCGMSKVESKTANNLINKYGLTDNELTIKRVKERASLVSIVKEQMGEDFDFGEIENKNTGVTYKKQSLCVYQDLRPNSKCIYCGIERSKGFGKPCIYLSNKSEGATD